MAGFTSAGFQRKTFNEIRESIISRIESSIPQTFNFSSNSYIGKLVDNIALEIDETYQLLEAGVEAKTINGAEGVYLDEILSSVGVFRQGAIPATDFIAIGLDQSAPSTQTIDSTYTFSGPTSFKTSSDTSIGTTNTSAVFIPVEGNFEVDNNISILLTGREGQSVLFSVVTDNTTTQQDFEDILQGLVNTVRDSIALTPTERQKVYFTPGEGAYIGFTSNTLNPIGVNLTFAISQNTTGAANNLLFTRYSIVNVVAEDEGFVSFGFGDITGIDPQPLGFVSSSNIGPTFNGGDVETDAQYRLRAERERLVPDNSTRVSLEAALLAEEGISQARVYENPTSVDRPEALANTFNTVVLGGTSQQITNIIFNKKPINTKTSGEQYEDFSLSGGLVERVFYTTAKQQQYQVIVEYKTRDNQPVANTHKLSIINNIADITNIAEIGDSIENDYIKGIVYDVVGFTRLNKVVVKVKGPNDSLFVDKDISLNFDEYVTIPSSNISVVQIFS